jgi:hypothetical protein
MPRPDNRPSPLVDIGSCRGWLTAHTRRGRDTSSTVMGQHTARIQSPLRLVGELVARRADCLTVGRISRWETRQRLRILNGSNAARGIPVRIRMQSDWEGDLERNWEDPNRSEAARLGKHLPDLDEGSPGGRAPSTPRMVASRDRRQRKRAPSPRAEEWGPSPTGDGGPRTPAAPFAPRVANRPRGAIRLGTSNVRLRDKDSADRTHHLPARKVGREYQRDESGDAAESTNSFSCFSWEDHRCNRTMQSPTKVACLPYNCHGIRTVLHDKSPSHRRVLLQTAHLLFS